MLGRRGGAVLAAFAAAVAVAAPAGAVDSPMPLRTGGVWQLSKPAAWTLAMKDARGRVVNTFTGTGTEVAVAWDGKTAAGTYAYNGTYTWALTAKATEGTGTYTQSGTFGLTGARPGHHTWAATATANWSPSTPPAP